MSGYGWKNFFILLILFSVLFFGGCDLGGDDDDPPSFSVTVSGKVAYEDKEYSSTGFTGMTSYTKAVRFAEVELVNSGNGAVLGRGSTDATGAYSITANTYGGALYLRVLASTATLSAPPVEVRNMSGRLYSAGGSNIIPEPDAEMTYDLTLPVTSEAAGAFNILDIFTIGGEFIMALEGSFPPLLKGYWQTGDGSSGTYFCTEIDACSLGEGVYIYGGTALGEGDTDEFDDDILWHEYGHFAAHNFSKDDSPGGWHLLTENDYDLRLTWSEGWGHFYMAAIKAWLGIYEPSLLSTASDPSLYVDTASGGVLTKFDVALPTLDMKYATNEVAVANVLWNVLLGEGGDMTVVWDVFSGYFPGIASPASLEIFWDGWIDRIEPSPSPEFAGHFHDRSIYYSLDAFETYSSPFRNFSVPNSEAHTLYAGDGVLSDDEDFVAFDVISGQDYTLSTSNLLNGADTTLTLYDTDGVTALVYNDNFPEQSWIAPYNCDIYGICHENEKNWLRSRLSFTAWTSATFYVKVTTSVDRPDSAGRYGTYTLSIIDQL